MYSTGGGAPPETYASSGPQDRLALLRLEAGASSRLWGLEAGVRPRKLCVDALVKIVHYGQLQWGLVA